MPERPRSWSSLTEQCAHGWWCMGTHSPKHLQVCHWPSSRIQDFCQPSAHSVLLFSSSTLQRCNTRTSEVLWDQLHLPHCYSSMKYYHTTASFFLQLLSFTPVESSQLKTCLNHNELLSLPSVSVSAEGKITSLFHLEASFSTFFLYKASLGSFPLLPTTTIPLGPWASSSWASLLCVTNHHRH